MGEFSITGKLSVAEGVSHQELLIKLFKTLKDQGIHFVGETKEIIDKNNT